MLPFRLLPVLPFAFFLGCAPAEGEPVDLAWSVVELPCDADRAATDWLLPDPPPVAVLVRESGDAYTGYNQQITAREDGSMTISCGADVTVTYAQVIE